MLAGTDKAMAGQETARKLHDEAWAEVADLLDLQLSPLGLRAMDALGAVQGKTVLDVGCGAGQSLAQLAGRVGAHGRVIGVDIAARLLDVARSRLGDVPQLTLLHGDAARLDVPEASVDAVFSRFGVMAFADPVAAFSNLRRMLRPGGRIAFVCWRALRENEIDFLPLQAAGLDIAADETPFSFARREVVTEVLCAAGFGAVTVDAFDAEVSSGEVDAMTKVLTKVGPLGKILRETPALMIEVEPKVRAALAARLHGGRVSLGAATWVVNALAA